MNSPLVNPAPPRRLTLAVATISAAALGFEVSLTRLFSVLLRYHFAFLAISIALCGLGLGGYLAQWQRRRRQVSLPGAALGFAFSTVLSLVLILHGVFRFIPDAYWLSSLLVLVPFCYAGIFLAEAFARHAAYAGRLYAWDLAGAALAAVGTVGVLQLLGAINACLAIAALGALAGTLAAEPAQPAEFARRRGSRMVTVAPILLLLLPLANLGSRGAGRWLDIPAVPPHFDAQGSSVYDRGITQPLFTELGTPGHTSRIVETRWNAFARTDVVNDSEMPNSFYVYTNGNVPTNMMQWDGSLFTLPQITVEFPLIDWIFSNSMLGNATYRRADMVGAAQPHGAVLSIGPGGGLDALMALRYGAAHFEGAEINPSIVGLMRDYRKYNGGIYQKPNVKVRTADGRDAVRQALHAGKRYALIYSALTKTATTGQGTALLESYIYTQNAFDDYWNALDDDGEYAIVTDQPILVARLFATTLAVLKSHGIDEKAACRHIVIAHDPHPGPYSFGFIVSRRALTPAQTYRYSDSTQSRNLDAIWLTGRTSLSRIGPYPDVATGKLSLAGFVAWWRNNDNLLATLGAAPPNGLGIDVSPCPDDRPFVLDLSVGLQPMFRQLFMVAALLGLLLAALSWRNRDNTPGSFAAESANRAAQWLFIVYFATLGVGFMLVEIPLTQKLILPLGYPTLALTVILFALLLGGGAGAWFSQLFHRQALRRWTIVSALAVACLSLGLAHSAESVSQMLLGLHLAARCALVGAALLPCGFFLGAPFPSGMRLFAQKFERNVPLVWGLNGVASVVGSLGAAMGAKLWGFHTVLLCGAAVYVAAAALLAVASGLGAAEGEIEVG